MPSLNLDLNYFDNVKTLRLVARLGPGSDVLPIRIWAWAGKHHPETGRLALLEAELEHICGWWGKKGEMVGAMLETNFIRRVGDFWQINDWLEHSGHLAAFKKRASKAAQKRWGFKRKKADATSIAKDTTKQSSCSAVLGSAVQDVAFKDSASRLPAEKSFHEQREYHIPEPKDDPLCAVVMYYKAVRKAVPYNDRTWDKQHFSRASKSSKALLEICGSYEAAKACLDQFATDMDAAGRSWTLETVVKWAHEWKGKNGGKDYGATNSASFFNAVAKQRTARKFAELRKVSTAGNILDGVRNMQGLRDSSETGHGATGNADEGALETVREDALETETDRGQES